MSYTILIAEDNETNFSLIKTYLKKSLIDYTIIWKTNGLEAIKECENNKIDLILMDIRMPLLNGYDATREIKKINPQLPIIIQTAYADSNSRLEAISCGCNEILYKPYSSKQLLSKIKKYLK